MRLFEGGVRWPDTEEDRRALLEDFGERAVGTALDNAHDMGGPSEMQAAHVGTSLPGYVQVEMDRIAELDVLSVAWANRYDPADCLTQGAYLALRQAITQAAYEYADSVGYTVYEPVDLDADPTDPDPTVVATHLPVDADADLPYPEDEEGYARLVAVLATKALARDGDVEGVLVDHGGPNVPYDEDLEHTDANAVRKAGWDLLVEDVTAALADAAAAKRAAITGVEQP